MIASKSGISQTDRTSLRMDHRAVETALQIVLEAARANDEPTLSVVWTEFERRLTNHIDGEEKLLLPHLEAEHPEEVRVVREEHVRIRDLIAKIGVLTDLHEVRLGHLERLRDLLDAHTKSEERVIYELAGQQSDPTPIQSFARHVRRSMS